MNYTHDFKVKIITKLMIDKAYILSLHDIIQPSFFEDNALEEIVTLLLSYFNQYKTVPDIVDWQQMLSNYPKDEFEILVEVLRQLYSNVKELDISDYTYAANEFRDFCRSQHIKQKLLSTIEYFQDNADDVTESIDTVVNTIQKAGMAGSMVTEHYTLNDINNVDIRYSNESVETVVTKWDVINEIFNGGLPKGTLTIISAPTGAGKTWLCVNLAHGFQKYLHDGWHISLELSETYCARRYDAVHTSIPLDDLSYNISNIKSYYTNAKLGDLKIIEYPPNTLTINILESELTKAQVLGNLPDFVIVDYAELMLNTNKNLDSTQALADTILELRRLAKKFNIALISPSQTNREGYNSDIVRGSHAATAFAQLFHADHVITYSRKMEDKPIETARLFIEKNRSGKDKILLPCHHSEKTCNINIYSASSQKGQHLLMAMREQGTAEPQNTKIDYKTFKKRK